MFQDLRLRYPEGGFRSLIIRWDPRIKYQFNLVEKTSDAEMARRLRSELPARSFVPLLPLLTRVKGTHSEKEYQTGTRRIITLSAGKGGLLEV